MNSASVPPVDYLMIGHVTYDLLSDGRFTIGGTAAYGGLTACALGRRVGVLTSAGPDFEWGALDRAVTWICSPAPETTTFENLYEGKSRHQWIRARARPLTMTDLPASWESASIVHVGPVMGECDPAFVSHFSGRAFVGLTPQGWLRQADQIGRITPRIWDQMEWCLPLASAVIVSLEDLQGDWEVALSWAALTQLLVVTQGSEGGTLFIEGSPYRFPALEVEEVSSTGAGDIFAAAFFSVLSQVANPHQAVHLATCLASRSVMHSGLKSVPGPNDLSACAWNHLA